MGLSKKSNFLLDRAPQKSVNASRAASRLPAHDSGPVWVAGPSPYGSFIRTSTPVYPGAHLNISSIKTSTMITSSDSLFRERDAQSCVRVLLHTMYGSELSRVRTELGRLHQQEAQ